MELQCDLYMNDIHFLVDYGFDIPITPGDEPDLYTAYVVEGDQTDLEGYAGDLVLEDNTDDETRTLTFQDCYVVAVNSTDTDGIYEVIIEDNRAVSVGSSQVKEFNIPTGQRHSNITGTRHLSDQGIVFYDYSLTSGNTIHDFYEALNAFCGTGDPFSHNTDIESDFVPIGIDAESLSQIADAGFCYIGYNPFTKSYDHIVHGANSYDDSGLPNSLLSEETNYDATYEAPNTVEALFRIVNLRQGNLQSQHYVYKETDTSPTGAGTVSLMSNMPAIYVSTTPVNVTQLGTYATAMITTYLKQFNTSPTYKRYLGANSALYPRAGINRTRISFNKQSGLITEVWSHDENRDTRGGCALDSLTSNRGRTINDRVMGSMVPCQSEVPSATQPNILYFDDTATMGTTLKPSVDGTVGFIGDTYDSDVASWRCEEMGAHTPAYSTLTENGAVNALFTGQGGGRFMVIPSFNKVQVETVENYGTESYTTDNAFAHSIAEGKLILREETYESGEENPSVRIVYTAPNEIMLRIVYADSAPNDIVTDGAPVADRRGVLNQAAREDHCHGCHNRDCGNYSTPV